MAGNRFAAPVDDDGTHAHRGHKRNIFDKLALERRIIQHAAPQLDHDDLTVKGPNVLHRLDQCDGFGNCLLHGMGPGSE